jgi:hypothetical protein
MDLNTILNAALTAAVAEVTAPMLSRISSLESRLFAAERVADTEPQRPVQIAISGFDDLAARIAGSQLRINALFALLNTLILTDDDAINSAKDGEFTARHPLKELMRTTAEAVAENAMEAHHSTYDHDEFYRDSDAIFDDIEDRLDTKIDNKIDDQDDLAGRVRSVLRDDITFSVSVD